MARPLSPRQSVRTFKLSEKVDAYHNDGRWEGVITAVHDGDMYTVYFRPSKVENVFSGADLRLHTEWVQTTGYQCWKKRKLMKMKMRIKLGSEDVDARALDSTGF